MKRIYLDRNVLKIILFSCLLLKESVAFAYLDPGSIGLFIQGLIAGIVGFFGIILAFWDKIKKRIKAFWKK